MLNIFKMYENEEEMKRTISQVRERCSLRKLDRSEIKLNIQIDHSPASPQSTTAMNLFSEDLMVIYKTCTYESALFEDSPWCYLMSYEDRDVR